MNNFLKRFYFLSKLTTSFILLTLLILLSYLFVKAYLDKRQPNNTSLKIEELSNQIYNLANIVKQNSNSLDTVKNFVQDNKKSVKNISTDIKTIKNTKLNDNLVLQIDELSEENRKLKDELYHISSMISKLENIRSSDHQIEISSKPISIIIKLIKLKLDNGSSFIQEIELLKESELGIEYLSNVEKLSIYANENFPGLDKLINNFDIISSSYLNQYYSNKTSNYFIKNFFNFISIQPNLNNNIQDENVLLLSSAKKNLLDKNLSESINQLNSLNGAEHFFSTWIKQAKYYSKVNNLLDKF